MATPYRFGGLDNQHDPKEVGLSGCTVVANVDHRSDMSVVRRAGYTASAVTGAGMHSLWGSQDGTFGYVADGVTLFHLDSTLTASAMTPDFSSAAPMSFVECDSTVAVITSEVVRFAVATNFVTPALPTQLDGETQFHAAMTGLSGTCGCYYNGRLYVGRSDGFIVFSAPFNIGAYDTRDYLLPVGFPVVAMFATDDGVWACGSQKLVFLAGTGPSTFTYRDVLPVGVFSGARIIRKDWKLDGAGVTHAVHSTRGTLLLGPSGGMIDVSAGRYYPPVGSGHRSIVRQENGYIQLLTVFTYSEDGVEYAPPTLDTEHLTA